jgi:hypothetical protein
MSKRCLFCGVDYSVAFYGRTSSQVIINVTLMTMMNGRHWKPIEQLITQFASA